MLKSGFSVTTKKGFSAELGVVSVDASINKDSETQQKTAEASFSIFGNKLAAERSVDPGILVPDNVDTNPEFCFENGPFKKNLVTGEVSQAHSANLYKVGGSFFFGADISFDPQKAGDKIQTCRPK
jgi:hypothetical protein